MISDDYDLTQVLQANVWNYEASYRNLIASPELDLDPGSCSGGLVRVPPKIPSSWVKFLREAF